MSFFVSFPLFFPTLWPCVCLYLGCWPLSKIDFCFQQPLAVFVYNNHPSLCPLFLLCGEREIFKNVLALSTVFLCHHNGVHVHPGWCSQEHQQCHKEMQTLGSYWATYQHHPVSNCGEEVRLHWQIWNHWWSQSWENCCELHRQVKQVWNDQPRFDVQLQDLGK